MPRFVGAFTNKIDAKGRLSVPSDFRAGAFAGTDAGAFNGVALFPSFTDAALEGGGLDLLDDVKLSLNGFNLFGEDREAFEFAVLSSARKLNFDGDGRITLPGDFIEHAGLNGQAVFVGRGDKFQIWTPEAYAEKLAAARARAKELRDMLGGAAGPRAAE